MSTETPIDWLDEALACDWPLERIESMADAARRLHLSATFIHADVIVFDRDRPQTPYPTREERFVSVREAGTVRGANAANRAMQAAGIEA